MSSVDSTSLSAIGYHEPSDTLQVQFVSGSVYQYHGVEKYLYEQLMQAASKGGFFNANIKNQYAYSRVG